MSAEYSEDKLVQQTTADYFENNLKWHSVYAYNKETFGDNGTLGRKDKRKVVLTLLLKGTRAKNSTPVIPTKYMMMRSPFSPTKA